jgi:hypothetical protein
MSWSLFRSKCAVLTGPQHVSREKFSDVIASAYHQSILLHFDSMTGGGKVVNAAPKLPILYNSILAICNQNWGQHNDVNLLEQIGDPIKQYWVGLIISGPTGTVPVSNTGSWVGPKVVQNLNFNIILNAMIMSFKIHLMTLTGTYTSSVVPGVSTPWSGGSFTPLP